MWKVSVQGRILQMAWHKNSCYEWHTDIRGLYDLYVLYSDIDAIHLDFVLLHDLLLAKVSTV